MPEHILICSEKYIHGGEKRFLLAFLEAETAAFNSFIFLKSTVASPLVIRTTAEHEQQGIVLRGVT